MDSPLVHHVLGRGGRPFPSGPPPGPGPWGGGPPPPPSAGMLAPQAEAVQMMKFVSLAIYTAVVWDIATTYAMEVRHVYRSRWTIIKVLWFLNRIGVPVTLGLHAINVFKSNPSPEYCQMFGNSTIWSSVINIFVIQFTLCLRVNAIYQRTRSVTIITSLLLILSTLARILIFALKPVFHSPSPVVPGFSVCLEFPDLTIAGAYWAALILDTVLFIMIVVRIGNGIPDRKALRHAPLIVLIFRDGAIYYGVVVVSIALTVAGYYSLALIGPCTSSYLFLGIMSIACSRLILNLRNAVAPSATSASMSGRDAVFGHPELLLTQHASQPNPEEIPLPESPIATA